MDNSLLSMKPLFLILSFFLFVSCGSESVLIVTDSFWNDFSAGSSTFYNVKNYLNVIRGGIRPDFVTYQDPLQDFPLWIQDQTAKKEYKSLILTTPFASYLQKADASIQTVIMGGFVKLSNSDYNQIISANKKAFFDAGAMLKSQWLDEERLPVVLLWKGDGDFEENYQALLEGWGDEDGILTNNILILEQDISDSEGKINSFYKRFDFRNGKWCLFAAAEPALGEVLKTWPVEENIVGILMSADHDFLPKNIQYLIVRDFMGILSAAADLCATESVTQTVTVNTLFIKR
ncbi:MAG: hypothetical protein B6241_05555 [Spirochaetaceae bacterium 4572_59]|nr:MAG: hypothetical protein B6241_05555 [Spirochaetaceae bacterium 4572_59]